ncbi:unnamed protein product [marine sediment metagenome]|uniref:Uncharacterized protein n=1 Tax=marine sediment metagenome TaxID=412755 RepID=X0SSR3_9ZZZZ
MKKDGRVAGQKINGILYRFITVKPKRFFGTKDYWVGEAKVTIMNPERTLIDGLAAPKYCGDWAEVYSVFESQLPRLDLDKMVDYSTRLDTAVVKRLGWIFEKVGVEDSILQRLESVPIRGYRILDPNGPRKGPCNRRWMIQENIFGKIAR